ncbi:MAG: protein translocase subunit SecD [Alphaproteobacteria bacterium]|nr:protein translocase subunit SecD [Alphaproteobacteria bacterium]
MIYLERWKVILISVVCAIGILYSAPNFFGKERVEWLQAHTPSFFPNQTVNLGLDLRGGSHLLLEVATDSVIDEHMQAVVDQVRTSLRAEKPKIGYTNLGLSGGAVRFKLIDPAQQDRAREALRHMNAEFDISSKDGEFSLSMSESKILERKRSAMDQSIEIVRRRIDETGTREPSIQRQGDNRILVQLPGLDDPERIKNLLGQTAKLTFRLVDETADPSSAHAPPGEEILPSTEDGRNYVVQKRIMVSGETLVDSQPSFQEGMPVVSFKFDSIGARRFGEATRKHVGKLFAIVLDNKVISAPVIREPIVGGAGVISGHFTTQSAQDLALLLRAGALPASIKVLEERTVGPGLGTDSINAGATASLIGLGLVVVYFVFAYGLFGIFADIALIFNIALIFAILSILQATLTLPGIAGIVLTIGTALDANVLVYERIREEMRLGRSVIGSIDAGYSHALSAIVDANMTTLIAAILMFMFGSGPVKGFAVTLTIGIVTSIFSALMITRLIISLWVNARRPKAIPL